MKLNDKVVVVTGSGNGIGEAFARRFVHEGAKVVVTDIEADAVERVTSDIGAVGLAVDITVEENVQAVADLARRTYGEIDVWFSNAGYSGPPEPGDLQSNAVWDLTWHLHVMAHVYAARAVLPSMVDRGEGYLLQTASSVALVGAARQGLVLGDEARGPRARRVAGDHLPAEGCARLVLLPGPDDDPHAPLQPLRRRPPRAWPWRSHRKQSPTSSCGRSTTSGS